MFEIVSSELIYRGLHFVTALACAFALAKPNVLLKKKMPALLAGALILTLIGVYLSIQTFTVSFIGGLALGVLVRTAYPAPPTVR